MTTNLKKTFSKHFIVWKYIYSASYVTEVCFEHSIKNKIAFIETMDRRHTFFLCQWFICLLTLTWYTKKYAHGFCFAVLCCGYTLTDFPISIRLTSLSLWQSNDCPSASKATLMNMDKYFMWIQYEWLHNHNKAKHNKTVCIFLGIYCTCYLGVPGLFITLSLLQQDSYRRKWV